MEQETSEPTKLLEAKINAVLQGNAGYAGLSVIIASSSRTFPFQAGYADIATKQLVHRNHLFGIGSITKVFVAVVVLQLVEEGKLSLRDRVDRYLGHEITHDIENASSASIWQLLNHTSGIDSWEDDPDWIVHGRGRLVQPGYIWSKTEPLDYIRRPRRTAALPGIWSYSNTNYTLLGLIIEKVTTQTGESEIRRRILQPLQMEHTFVEGFEDCQNIEKLITSRYHLASGQFRKDAGVCPAFIELKPDLIEARGYNMSTSWLAGGMISTADDLRKFAHAMQNGRFLRLESRTVMQQWIETGRNGQEMGLGLFRMSFPNSGAWLGHSGGVLGFSSGLWWHEKQNCCVCVLNNVGTVHSGNVVIGSKKIITDTEFLSTALLLAKSR